MTEEENKKAMTGHKSIQLPLDIIEIQKCIPHRFPFLLIDRVTALEPYKSVVAIKNVSVSDPVLQGHFPGNPIYPGVMIIEGIAQASAILGYHSLPDCQGRVLLTEVSKSRFKRQVVPGDVLQYEVAVIKSRPPFFWFEGKAIVGDSIVATVSISALMS